MKQSRELFCKKEKEPAKEIELDNASADDWERKKKETEYEHNTQFLFINLMLTSHGHITVATLKKSSRPCLVVALDRPLTLLKWTLNSNALCTKDE